MPTFQYCSRKSLFANISPSSATDRLFQALFPINIASRSEASKMNCPSCGLLNLSSAATCVYCKVPLDLETVSKAGEVASKKVIDLKEAKNSVAVAKNRTFLSSPSQSKTS